MIYTQKKPLGASLCGADSQLSCIGAFILVEDALTELMGELEIDGLTAISKYNAVWLFTKNHIKFLRPVGWKEPVTVESFVTAKNKILLYIDTCVRNSAGEIAVYSRVELCGIDRETLRIRRADTIGVDERVECEPARHEIAFFGKEHFPMDLVDRVTVRASNIDYAHHTNNVEYMRFLINTFSLEQLAAAPIREMEVGYLNQSFEGDTLDIRRAELPGRKVFEITREDARIFRCDMRF